MTDRFFKKTNANKIGRYTNKKPIQKTQTISKYTNKIRQKNKIKQTNFVLP